MLAKQTPILVSNILYLGINIFGLIKEIRVNETKKEFRKLNPYFDNGMYHCLGYFAKTEKGFDFWQNVNRKWKIYFYDNLRLIKLETNES